jgi:hypothetical protein
MRYVFGYQIFTLKIFTMLVHYWQNGQLSRVVEGSHLFFNLAKNDEHVKIYFALNSDALVKVMEIVNI